MFRSILTYAVLASCVQAAFGFTVTGTIRTPKGMAVGGVTVSLALQVTYHGVTSTGTETATTNTSGVYTFSLPTPTPIKGDNFSVRSTPAKTGFTFSPVYQDAVKLALTASVTHDFTANTLTYYTIAASAGSNASISPSGSIQVQSGTNKTFTVSVDEGYIEALTVDGVPVTYTTSYTFNDVQSDHTIYVYGGVRKTYICRCLSGSNGTTVPSGDVQVVHGQDGTVLIVPDAGYRVLDVTFDGVSIGSDTSYTFYNITADHTLYASFTANTHTITASAGTGGTISPSGSVSVQDGTDRSFTISPSSCYRVSNVLVDGSSVGAVTAYTFNDVVTNHTISASFERLQYTVTPSAGTGGTVNPSVVQSVPCGNNVSFQFTPDACHTITDVLLDGVSQGASASFYLPSVSADHTVHVDFSPITYDVVTSAGTGGSVSPAGTVAVECGTTPVFAIAADSGYITDDVVLDGHSRGAVDTVRIYNVRERHWISASFAPVTGIEQQRVYNACLTEIAPLPLKAGNDLTVRLRTAVPGRYRITVRGLDGAVTAVPFDGWAAAGMVRGTWRPEAGAGMYTLEITGPGFTRYHMIPVVK